MMTASVSFVTSISRRGYKMMIIKLSSGKEVILDDVIKDSKAESIRWLQEYKERNMKIEDMTTDQCYAELDRLAERRRTEGRGSSPEACYAKWYCDDRRKKVKKRLRQLKASLTRPGDGRVYGPGAASWQRAGG